MAQVETRVRADAAGAPGARSVPDPWIWAIAGSGVVPFVVLALLVWGGDAAVAERARAMMAGYGAVVLGFLGGARWGAELVRAPAAPSKARLVAAAVPTVVAWGALLLEARASLLVLVAGGIVQLAWDLLAARSGLLPAWTGRVRALLSGVGVAAMLLAALA